MKLKQVMYITNANPNISMPNLETDQNIIQIMEICPKKWKEKSKGHL